MISMSLNNIHN